MYKYHISIKRYYEQKAVLGYKVQALSPVTHFCQEALPPNRCPDKHHLRANYLNNGLCRTTHLTFKPHRSLCLIDSLRIQILRAGKSRLSRQKIMLHWKSGMRVRIWSGKRETWGKKKRTGSGLNYKKPHGWPPQ